MRTRNTDTTKSAVTPKRTPPAKNSAAKSSTTPASSKPASAESPAMATPKSSDTKRGPATRGKQAKSAETINTEPQPEPTPVVEEEAKAPDDAVEMTGETKPATRRKTIRRVIKKVVRKVPASARVASGQTPKSEESEQSEQVQVQVVTKENHLLGVVEPEVRTESVEIPDKNEESSVKSIEGSVTKDLRTLKAVDIAKKEEEFGKNEISLGENVVQSSEEQEPTVTDVEPIEDKGPTMQKEQEEELRIQQAEPKTIEDTAEPKSETGEMEADPKGEMTDFDGLLEEADEEVIADQEVHDELSQEDYPEGNLQEQSEEAAALEEERAELNAAAKERKLRKELEIFVGGLERDVVEEDIKRVFQNAGEVVDVRLHKDPSTNKNKGYAFVRFATKEQASRALSEMRNPVIRGKRCGIAASEDNDTLFVGNICNSWTKEAIKQKLKDYGIEAIEKVTLVADPKHEGLSRGFAFLEFSSHAEAMLAYKRLQKPDAIFGHSERTVKVAFAEPLREPDPEVMAQVKSVFVDGLPPHWDEDHVREKFIQFGEIARIMLARNMSTAKRKDFGFVDFTTHEAALACVEGINNTELGDGNSKTKVRARLSNPLPKTQAVKGGMAGGFRIARSSGGTFSRFEGRGFGRGGHAFNRANFQHVRDFYPRGPSQGGIRGFANTRELDGTYPPFHGRQNFGPGERWGFRSAHQVPRGALLPTRPHLDRPRHGGHDGYDPLRRQPFPSEDAFNQPFSERQFDDRYFYEETIHRMKRPYFMTDQNPDYVESSTHRPRIEYPETSIPHRGDCYRDAFGADAGLYPQDYYSSDYDGGMHPSFYGGDRLYGRAYYY